MIWNRAAAVGRVQDAEEPLGAETVGSTGSKFRGKRAVSPKRQRHGRCTW